MIATEAEIAALRAEIERRMQAWDEEAQADRVANGARSARPAEGSINDEE